MRSPSLEPHDQFEGVGAHEMNTRFDWIPEEHGSEDDTSPYDPPEPDLEVTATKLPALVRALVAMRPENLHAQTVPGRLDGGDSSHYQVAQGGGRMDIGPGLWWWVHKAAQSTGYRDGTLLYAIGQMWAAGVEIPGCYFWGSTAPGADPEKQAANWIGAAGDYIDRLMMMGDMEEQGLTEDTVCGIYETVEDYKYKKFGLQTPCSNYTGLFVSNGIIYRSDRIRMSRFGPRPTIVAAYVSRERLNSLLGPNGKPYDAWQWGSNGPVPNIVGRCDQDEVENKEAFLLSLHGASTTTPPPTPHQETENMATAILQIPGRNAQFIGTGTLMPDGSVHCVCVTWYGPGPEGNPFLTDHAAAGDTVHQPTSVETVQRDLVLVGCYPEDIQDDQHSWTAADFAHAVSRP